MPREAGSNDAHHVWLKRVFLLSALQRVDSFPRNNDSVSVQLSALIWLVTRELFIQGVSCPNSSLKPAARVKFRLHAHTRLISRAILEIKDCDMSSWLCRRTDLDQRLWTVRQLGAINSFCFEFGNGLVSRCTPHRIALLSVISLKHCCVGNVLGAV